MIEALKSLFSWVDRPWKALAVLVTLPLLLIGWLTYTERELVDEYLQGIVGEPEINTEAFDAVAEDLLRFSDIVLLFSVDMALNSQTVIDFAAKDESQTPVGIEALFLEKDDDLDLVVDALRNQTICVDYPTIAPEDLSPVGVWMVEHGYLWACGHKLPSGTSAVAGFVTIGWKVEPSERDKQVADVALTRASDALTK